MKEIYVIPAARARVHHPNDPTRIIAPGGELVPRNSYILERLREGDLSEGKAPAAKAAKAAKTAKKEGAE